MKIAKHKVHSHYYYINNACRKGNLYKYMTMETALCCLDSRTVRFVEPSKWPDKFESLYYKASYHNVDPKNRVNKKLVACCFAMAKACEAAWNQYTYDGKGLSSICVQFVIDRQKLQSQLDQYASRNNARVYEGVVDYSHSDYTIANIRKRSNPLHTTMFDHFSLVKYLNLLLMKRSAFKYESEVRFFIINNDRRVEYEMIDVPVDWNAVLKKILISSKTSYWEEKLFREYVNVLSPGVVIERCNILAAPNDYDYTIEV